MFIMHFITYRSLPSRLRNEKQETRLPQTNGNLSPTTTRTTPEKPTTSTGVSYIQNHRNACRKCAQQGHTAAQCENTARYFCWTCGKADILTKNCCPHNDTRLNVVYAQEPNTNTESLTSHLSEPEYNGNSIRCKLTVANQIFWASIDTGSWHSYIHEKVIANLPTSVYAQRACTYSVFLATGSKDRVKLALDITLQFQNRLISHRFLTLKSCVDSFILSSIPFFILT